MITPPANRDSRSFRLTDYTKHFLNFGFDPVAQSLHLRSHISQCEELTWIDWTAFHERRVDMSDKATIDSQPGTDQNMNLKSRVVEVYFLDRSRRFNSDQAPTSIFIGYQNINPNGAFPVNKSRFKERAALLNSVRGLRNSLLEAVTANLNTARKQLSGQSADLFAFFKDRQRLLVRCRKQILRTEPKQLGTLLALEKTAFGQESHRNVHGS